MATGWANARMGDVAPLVRRPVETIADKTYREIGIRSFGKGVFHKTPTTGLEIGSKRVFAVEPGDLLFNIVFAWEGAVAVASPSERGMIGSHRFLTCLVDKTRADARYLNYWFSRGEGRDRLLWASPGGAGRNRTLGIEKLAAIEVPLPPLEEQRRIVARIDALAAKITEARGLREEAAEASRLLLRAIIRADANGRIVRVRDIATLRSPDVHVAPDQEYQFAGVYSFGRGVFRSVRKMGNEFSYPRLTRVREGEFIYPKLMAWEGALGVVPSECDGMVVSTEFPVFEIDRAVIAPEVLDTHFRSPEVWPSLAGQSGGTNVRRRRLNPQDFLDLEVPLPSKATQQQLVDTIRRLREVSRLRTESGPELDALLPAILDRAFKGEL